MGGLVANGWEWIAIPFGPSPHFQPLSFYGGYSKNLFDGPRVVLKGGSPRTDRSMLHPSFRSWFQPLYQKVNERYAGQHDSCGPRPRFRHGTRVGLTRAGPGMPNMAAKGQTEAFCSLTQNPKPVPNEPGVSQAVEVLGTTKTRRFDMPKKGHSKERF